MSNRNRMKQIGGVVVGAIVGFIAGGGNPAGAIKGAYVGYQIGVAFSEVQLPPGPRLDNLNTDQYSYGTPIPWSAGIDVVPTTVVWMKENKYQEFSQNVEVAKNQFQSQASYSASIALDIGEGPYLSIEKIYLNNILFYDSSTPGAGVFDTFKNKSGNGETRVKFYRGDFGQLPDEAILADRGADAPAYRGRGLIVIENLDLSTKFFNTLPTFRVIAKRVAYDPLAAVGPTSYEIDELALNAAGAAGRLRVDLSNSLLHTIWGGSGRGFYRFNSTSFNFDHGHHYVTNVTPQGAFFSNQWNFDNGGVGDSDFDLSRGVQRVDYRKINQTITGLAFPTVKTEYAYTISRYFLSHEAATTTTIPQVSATLDYLYPFDWPREGWLNLGIDSSTTSTPFYFHTIPVIGSNEFYVGVVWYNGTSDARVNIGRLRYGRMLWHELVGFDLSSYAIDPGSGIGPFSAGSNQLWRVQLCARLFGDRVYVGIPGRHGVSRLAASVENTIAGTLIIDLSRFKWGPSTVVQKGERIYDWGANTYFSGPEVYALDASTYDQVQQRKLYEAWSVSDLSYGTMAQDTGSGNLYGYVNDNLVTDALSQYPALSAIADGHFYRIDPITLTPLIDYGDLSAYISGTLAYPTYPATINPVAAISQDRYLIGPWGIIEFDSVSNSIVGGASAENKFFVGWSDLKIGAIEGHYNVHSISATSDFTDIALTRSIIGNNTGTSGSIPDSSISYYRVFHTSYYTELNSGSVNLSDLVSALITRSELLKTSDIDVTGLSSISVTGGFTITDQSSIIDSLAALQKVYLFDIVEEDYKLKFILRENSTITRVLPAADLQAAEVNQKPFELKQIVPAGYLTPSRYSARFRDINAQYEQGAVHVESPFGETSVAVTIDYPLAMTSQQALSSLEKTVRSTKSAEGGEIVVTTVMRNSDLEVNQYVTVDSEDGSSFTGRVVAKEEGRPGLVKLQILLDSLANYTGSTMVEDFSRADVVNPPFRGELILIDSLPFNGNEDNLGVWVCVTLESGPASASQLSVSYDRGETFVPTQGVVNGVTAGRAVNRLLSDTDTHISSNQVLTFRPISGVFTSTTLDELRKTPESAVYFYGNQGRWEIIKIQTFTDNGGGTYTASNILRGYKGTAFNMDSHESGDWLIKFDRTYFARINAPDDALFNEYVVKAGISNPGGGRQFLVASTILSGYGRLPLPVGDFTGFRNGDDWELNWKRQARFGIEWKNKVNTSNDESEERYKVLVLDTAANDLVVREIETTTTSATYTSAQQVTDWGSNQTNLEIAVIKMSSLMGEGIPLRVSL